MESVEVLLQLVDRFMQAGFNQVVDADIAPAGQQLTSEAVQVIRWALNRLLLNLLEGVVDPFWRVIRLGNLGDA